MHNSCGTVDRISMLLITVVEYEWFQQNVHDSRLQIARPITSCAQYCPPPVVVEWNFWALTSQPRCFQPHCKRTWQIGRKGPGPMNLVFVLKFQLFLQLSVKTVFHACEEERFVSPQR